MDQQTKEIIKPLIRIVCDISEKQSLTFELLSTKLDITDDEKQQLLKLAKDNRQSLERIIQSLEVL